MKTSLFFICLTFLNIHDTFSQNIYSALHLNDPSNFNAKKPKKVVSTQIFFDSNGYKELRSVKSYDSLGLMLQEDRFNEEGKLEVRIIYTNNSASHLIEMSSTERWMTWGYLKDISFFSYDDKKFLRSIKMTDDAGNVSMLTSVICNESGHPIALTVQDNNGNFFGKETAAYHYDKNIFITTVYDVDDKRLSTDTSFIDPEKNHKGNPHRYESKNINGKVKVYEQDFKYDAFGNCIENRIFEIVTNSNGKEKKIKNRIFRNQYFY